VDQVVTPEQTFPVTPAGPAPIIFQNQRPQFRRMVMRGALLELITIGFYRFWLATNIRRHVWHSTSVDGDALEYTGTGKELLFGALLALAIFLPVYVVYFLIGIEAERMQAFASVPFGLFFYLFAQFAVFRARRYRMTRTVWRGVRFWMTGSGWDYAWRAALLMVLVILTLGLFLPWREAILERFKMRHSHYGDLQGRFEATGWEFFKQGWWLWLLVIIFGVILPLAGVAGTVELARRQMTAVPISNAFTMGVAFFYIVAQLIQIGMLLAAPFIYGQFKAIQWRWWISGVAFGSVHFTSSIRGTNLFGLYWKVVGWLLLILALLVTAIIGIVGSSTLGLNEATLAQHIVVASQQWSVLVAVLLSYVIAALMATAVMRLYLIHDVTARIAASTTVHNIAAAEDVAARGAAANAVGEGLADSLEIFGF
jgi:uncharacterized membrane protein YjgN (DUF898 family)